ncbi:MAG: hypothetical protein L3J96_04915 [Thermoplasmata archaeon]|nr:hypothetical protein [Thermoplasmata archaeon]
MRAEPPEAVAWAFHETLLEVLRRLNQAAERRAEVDGMEYVELERSMPDFWSIRDGENHLESAVRLLLENGLVGEDNVPKYAWDRRRMIGDRYCITPLGKAYLMRAISDSERIA